MTTESTNAAGVDGHDDQVEVRSGTVLRARREDIELHTADGLTLVGELALPPDRDPVATLVTLHPLPTHGGFMDSHVLQEGVLPAAGPRRHRRAALQHPRYDVAARHLRGASTRPASERFDVAAAIEFAEFHDLPHRWLLGWSFGTDLALMHGHDPAVEGAILLSPPLRFSAPSTCRRGPTAASRSWRWCPSTTTTCGRRRRRERFAAVPQARVVGVEGGRAPVGGGDPVRRALDEIVAVGRARSRAPLPRTGAASRWSRNSGSAWWLIGTSWARRRSELPVPHRRAQTWRWRGTSTSSYSSSRPAATGIASSAPSIAEQGGAGERGDDGHRAGHRDRALHDPRRDDVVLDLLVDHVVDERDDRLPRLVEERDRADERRAERRADHGDQPEEADGDREHRGVRDADDRHHDPARQWR